VSFLLVKKGDLPPPPKTKVKNALRRGGGNTFFRRALPFPPKDYKEEGDLPWERRVCFPEGENKRGGVSIVYKKSPWPSRREDGRGLSFP